MMSRREFQVPRILHAARIYLSRTVSSLLTPHFALMPQFDIDVRDRHALQRGGRAHPGFDSGAPGSLRKVRALV